METSVRLTSPPLEKGFRLLFGSPIQIRKSENTLYVDAIFPAGKLFCLEVYDRFLFGNKRWALFVAQTVEESELADVLPNVFPGAKVLLEAKGNEKVSRAKDWISSIAVKRDPSELHPSVFRKQHAIINTSFTLHVPRKPFL